MLCLLATLRHTLLQQFKEFAGRGGLDACTTHLCPPQYPPSTPTNPVYARTWAAGSQSHRRHRCLSAFTLVFTVTGNSMQRWRHFAPSFAHTAEGTHRPHGAQLPTRTESRVCGFWRGDRRREMQGCLECCAAVGSWLYLHQACAVGLGRLGDTPCPVAKMNVLVLQATAARDVLGEYCDAHLLGDWSGLWE